MNALINFSSCFTTVGAGFLADSLHRNKYMTLTSIRKLFQSIAMIGPAVCFSIIPSCGSDRDLVIAMFIISMLCIGFVSGGDIPITTDMAPHFSGTLFGITNTVGSATGFLAPTIVGVILDKDVR